jgi:hypothetical protein
MGYGEFDGGGSVRWRIDHDNGDHAIADPDTRSGARGRDEAPPKDHGRFIVTVKVGKGHRQEVFNGPCDDTRIKVKWEKVRKKKRR